MNIFCGFRSLSAQINIGESRYHRFVENVRRVRHTHINSLLSCPSELSHFPQFAIPLKAISDVHSEKVDVGHGTSPSPKPTLKLSSARRFPTRIGLEAERTSCVSLAQIFSRYILITSLARSSCSAVM